MKTREQVSASRRHAANVMHAKHGAAVTEPWRRAADEQLNARLIARFGLDREALDFAQRLRSARRVHFKELSQKAKRSPQEVA